MDIVGFVCMDQRAIQISMFNAVATTATEMTGTAGGTGWSADILRNFYKVEPRLLLAASRGRFFIGAGRIMANKTVDS